APTADTRIFSPPSVLHAKERRSSLCDHLRSRHALMNILAPLNTDTCRVREGLLLRGGNLGGKAKPVNTSTCKLLILMEPPVGLEPTTFRLRIECSTN